MKWPQIVIIALYAATLAIEAHNHGKPKDQKHNFFLTAVAVALNVWILYCGGFWR